MFCTWYITVPSGYVIHLELQEFRLKYHSKCENCFLQIFDGNDETAPSIGRFCGYVYPPVLISSSNHFTIVVNCSGNLHKARFKAFYHSTDGKCCVTFYLHKSQNTTLLPPPNWKVIITVDNDDDEDDDDDDNNLHRHCFRFPLGHLHVPGEIANTGELGNTGVLWSLCK